MENPKQHLQARENYNNMPNIWKYEFLNISLNNNFEGDEYRRRAEELIEEVKFSFLETKELVTMLDLINNVEKLGLAHHFQNEIKKALDTIASIAFKPLIPREDIYSTALSFSLLRQHGYQVSQDIFKDLMDENSRLQKGTYEDVIGMLQLLEATSLCSESESILEEAKVLSIDILKNAVTNLDNDLTVERVCHDLELPYHWRVHWFDVRWQISAYAKHNYNLSTCLLELANINFNLVQATLQKDLKDLSRWWTNLGLTTHLNFARDRLVESFLCSVGLSFSEHHRSFRKWLTKAINFILIIDDVYDIYGSYQELKQFTDAVIRWDVEEAKKLPKCTKICFLAFYNSICEIAKEMEMENGQKQVLSHLRKAKEAEWYHKGYTPSFQEYLDNAWISSSGPLLFVHSVFSIDKGFTEQSTVFLEKNRSLIEITSLIIRLLNDLGTSTAEKERGDAPSAIQCYMEEMKVDEEVARKHIKDMITKAWKKINKICFQHQMSSQYQTSFANIATNMARVAHSLYQFGDGFGIQDGRSRNKFLSVLVEPLNVIPN